MTLILKKKVTRKKAREDATRILRKMMTCKRNSVDIKNANARLAKVLGYLHKKK